jgi:hydrogenase maturation protein HypF
MSSAVVSRSVRHRIRVVGVVQGVGFRPFVHRLAHELDLTGLVRNDSEGVSVEIEGTTQGVGRFEVRLLEDAPPLASIHRLEVIDIDPVGDVAFRIAASLSGSPARTFVSPDVSVCDDCLGEMFDPLDRRYRYPFINCTNCGPRFTITTRLPYDRPNTTMSAFAMCRECRAEYDNETDRRFHAQPIACPVCGPRIRFLPALEVSDQMAERTDSAIAASHEALERGEIVAIKGIGGYHLACDARSDEAVGRLRKRKNRAHKPFAVMVGDLATLQEIAEVDSAEIAELTSWRRPIVLVRRRSCANLSSEISPSNPYLGVMLPYTPLHHLLFSSVPGSDRHIPDVLVMTSGNLSDEPISYDDVDASRRLGGIADAWIVHDRPIHVPCDDSIVRIDSDEVVPIRRSRGYAPLPIQLPFEVGPTLATGAELKNTFCVASGSHAWVSQHIGDMGSVETLSAFERSVRQFCGMYEVHPDTVTSDVHPGYQVRRWAEESGSIPTELVQHHHAHVASLMAEHRIPAGRRLIGFVFDGTGYGSDGAIWGGEVLVAGYEGFERAAHLRYVPLPGGDATIRKPYRSALAHLRAAGIDWEADLPPVVAAGVTELRVLDRQLERGFQCVPCSSMGRLFDAVSSLLGIRHTVCYEAQAAIEVEMVASASIDSARPYRFEVTSGIIDPAAMLTAVVQDLRAGISPGPIAAGFHLAVVAMVADVADQVRGDTGIETVGLSGGVFQNVLLLRLVRRELERRGSKVLTHSVVPSNDGGIALGQLAVGGYRRQRGVGAIDA